MKKGSGFSIAVSFGRSGGFHTQFNKRVRRVVIKWFAFAILFCDLDTLLAYLLNEKEEIILEEKVREVILDSCLPNYDYVTPCHCVECYAIAEKRATVIASQILALLPDRKEIAMELCLFCDKHDPSGRPYCREKPCKDALETADSILKGKGGG